MTQLSLSLGVLLVCILLGSPVAGQNQQGTGRLEISMAPVVEPAGTDSSDWLIAAGDTVTLSVEAPAASAVTFYFRPYSLTGGRWRVGRDATAADDGTFSTVLDTSPDLQGAVWAEVRYPDGTTGSTGRKFLAAQALGRTWIPSEVPIDPEARGPSLRINVPSFTVTLLQDGRPVAAYAAGMAIPEYPLPIGERTAWQLIVNPAWIPPAAEWVRADPDVEAYERIPAGDPRNPMGAMKVPLGHAHVIHEALQPSDIGALVSHGCVRMLESDLFDLARRLAEAGALPISPGELERLRNSERRRELEFDQPLRVDVTYDTFIVADGVLRVFPDVYGRIDNPAQQLRRVLDAEGVPSAKLDDRMLERLAAQATPDRQFVVPLEALTTADPVAQGDLWPLTGPVAQEL